MSDKPTDRDLVLFLGAGFSADADLPTMKDFGKFSDEEYRKLCRENRGIKNAFSVMEHAGRVFRSFQKYCRRSTRQEGSSPSDPNNAADITQNMETVFCMAEAMREAQVNPLLDLRPEEPTEGRHKSFEQAVDSEYLVEQIQFWLWEVYMSLPLIDRDRISATALRAYDTFTALLGSDSIRKRTTVVTTNYDLVVEYLLWAMEGGCRCAYPLENHRDYIALEAGDHDPTRAAGDLGLIENSSNDPDCPVVCKLHGSVNFMELTRSGHPQLGICDDIVKRPGPVGKSRIPGHTATYEGSHIGQHARESEPAILAMDAIWCLRERYGISLTPAIVPPTYAKLQGQPWLRRIWHAAFEAIRQARTIVFVGYSLPESDGFMRAMFQAALAAREAGPPEVHVIDPFACVDPKLMGRYEKVFGACTDGAHPMKFSDAMQAGLMEKILRKED